IDVVGTASNGTDALARIEQHDPDVITLDLTMPELDGLGVLRALQGRARPRVIVVSISSIETELGVTALSLGAVDVIAKPTALASDRLRELSDELIAKVFAAAANLIEPPPMAATTPVVAGGQATLVMIGASTGGPQALTRLVAALPATMPVPVVIVLHIPIGYTEGIAARLNAVSPLSVIEASDGLELSPGRVVIARAGRQLRIERAGDRLVARLASAPVHDFMPSVNELFTSGAAAAGRGALGIVLTGMGDDGLIGARAIAAAGGQLLTEAAASCVVYGMPRCVFEAGLGASAVSLERMAEEILRRV
ncbi:MAG: chemotaxis protein CheB, partial [Kofleriaceae bacterium]